MFTLTDANKAKMLEVAEDLRGTCSELGDALEHFFGTRDTDQFSMELLAVLDEQVMLCEECGWWEESGFVNDNQVCDQCEPSDDS